MKRLLFIFLFIWMPSYGYAADLTPEESELANQIFGNTMSPYCPGRLLSDCPSTAASELKESIRVKIAEGQSQEEINRYLLSVYGDTIRAAPGLTGFGLAAWIIPFLFLVLTVLAMYRWLRRNMDRSIVIKSTETAKRKIDSNWQERVDKEISGET